MAEGCGGAADAAGAALAAAACESGYWDDSNLLDLEVWAEVDDAAQQRVVNDFNQRSMDAAELLACLRSLAERGGYLPFAHLTRAELRALPPLDGASRRVYVNLRNLLLHRWAADAGRYLSMREAAAACRPRGAIRIRYLQLLPHAHRLLTAHGHINCAAAPSLPPPLPRAAAERASVLVVGAGVAGLAAARQLALGHEVTVIEATDRGRPCRRPACPATAPRRTRSRRPTAAARRACPRRRVSHHRRQLNLLTQLCRQLRIEMRARAARRGQLPAVCAAPAFDAARRRPSCAPRGRRRSTATRCTGAPGVGRRLGLVHATCSRTMVRAHAVRYRTTDWKLTSPSSTETRRRFAADAAAAADAGGGGSGGGDSGVAGD